MARQEAMFRVSKQSYSQVAFEDSDDDLYEAGPPTAAEVVAAVFLSLLPQLDRYRLLVLN
ncbi:uncharacterized protein V1513DRAFT_428340 [Lipomyces chichibuensis]|uniref:uncharacterized protein n=1 Tax=Lipomyces chichibuensis TaxID=1546026 RepID=UPI003343F43C